MKKSGKLGAAALLLCGTLALSAMGMGFAKWQTTLHAEGDVAASEKWDVVLTDASVTLSNGAEIRGNDADYSLQNVIAANKKGQACIEAAVSRTKVTSYPTTGTQNSRFAVSSWLWLVDTTRFDLSKLGTLDTEQRRLTMQRVFPWIMGGILVLIAAACVWSVGRRVVRYCRGTDRK